VSCTVCPDDATQKRLELADIFRAHGHNLRGLSYQQGRVAGAIASCRTSALGGHVYECDECGHQATFYHSCRDRHCPKCQGLDEARWVEDRRKDLLPVEYFHAVFTIPDLLNPLFLRNQKTCYGLLFAAVAETLREVALNPRNLGARIGFTTVLHTWTQTLLLHPHIHCIVPGGGLSADGEHWLPSKPGFFLPVQVLSSVFRGKLLSKLNSYLSKGKIAPPTEDPLTPLRKAARKGWVVYCKPPFAGPEQVLRYLGRYANRIAISNERLVEMAQDQVTFRWEDRAHGNRKKLMTLPATDFLQRFLIHALPSGFVRIRHYGFLANAMKKRSIARCREALGVIQDADAEGAEAPPEAWQDLLLRLSGKDISRCPQCDEGHLLCKAEVPPEQEKWSTPGRATSP